MPSPARGIKKWPKTIRQETAGGSFTWWVRIVKAQVNSVRAEHCTPLRVTLADLAYVIDGHLFRLIQVDCICFFQRWWDYESSFSVSLVCVQCSPST